MSFQVGDQVVYPNQGVCQIEDVCRRSIYGRQEEFFVLRTLDANSTVMIPVSNVDNVGLRPLCDSEDVKELFAILQSHNEEPDSDWKNRYKENVEKMKTGCIFKVGEVLQNLHFLSFQKPLSFREKKMYDRARQLIASEIATVRTRDLPQVEGELGEMLDKAYGQLHSSAPAV